MGSNNFLGLVSHRMAPPTKEELFKAISIVQYPPVPDSSPEALAQESMYPAVQVLWVTEHSQTYYFVRLRPNLRFKDSLLALDGTKGGEAPWKTRRGWE